MSLDWPADGSWMYRVKHESEWVASNVRLLKQFVFFVLLPLAFICAPVMLADLFSKVTNLQREVRVHQIGIERLTDGTRELRHAVRELQQKQETQDQALSRQHDQMVDWVLETTAHCAAECREREAHGGD